MGKRSKQRNSWPNPYARILRRRTYADNMELSKPETQKLRLMTQNKRLNNS